MSKHPVVRDVAFSTEGLRALEMALEGEAASLPRKLLLDYPTVYVVRDTEHSGKRRVYVGETTNIRHRTVQHLTADARVREDWRDLSASDSSRMYVIGDEHFNKSLTLDIENQLMLYLSGVDEVSQLHNRRTNLQRAYYTQEHFEETFSAIWRALRHRDKKLFPEQRLIQDSALFKASPFHKLTEEQLQARDEVLEEVRLALQEADTTAPGRLILVRGAAGTGKTVLLSSLFYEMFQGDAADDDPFAYQNLDATLLINHDQQLVVYQAIAQKLGLLDDNADRVCKPTRFINTHPAGQRVDVILVDEAHLLWTQGKQSYQGTNMLADLRERAKVVIAVFDPKQAVATNQYWEQAAFDRICGDARIIDLKLQMRIHSEPQTWDWLRRFIDDGIVGPIPHDSTYELRVFSDAKDMHEAIRRRAEDQEHGLSRMLATFDWRYVDAKAPDDGGLWTVDVPGHSIPWNQQIKTESRGRVGARRHMSWAERPETIDEAGSIFTIQGFDLNYAGVIIGPSVRFRDGHVVFDAGASQHKNATQRRTLADKSKLDVSDELLRNQLNVLLTRGVHGLYIYAVDEPLQEALLAAQGTRGGS